MMDQIPFLLKYLIPKNKILGIEVRSLQYLRYEVILELNTLINTSPTDSILLVVNEFRKASLQDLLKVPEIKIIQFYVFLVNELKKINELEKQLISKPSTKEINAGIDKLQDVGFMNTVNFLANGEVWNYQKVLDTPYAFCFNRLKISKIENQITKKLYENN